MSLDDLSYAGKEAISIVGLACHLPDGGNGPNLDKVSFEQFLRNKGSSITRIPKERFNIDAWHGKGQGQVLPDSGGFLSGTEEFDHTEFGINAREFQKMTPVQFLLISTVFDALRDAGVDYRGSDTGVYVGAANPPAGAENWDDALYAADEYYESGIASTMLANRISFIFDLKGPSFPVDTACSAGLVGLHLAVRGLLAGECCQAVVAAANWIGDLESWIGFSKLGVLSPTSTCSPFDQAADGYVRSEAAVALILKPYSKAVADGDRIYANILGSAINSNGRGLSIVSPSRPAQQDVITRAYRAAARDLEDVDFVELHGTGTKVGDSTELAAIGELAFQKHRRRRPLSVGSVKSNVGHTELAAGLVSIVKMCYVLSSRQLLPNINFATPTSAVDWAKYDLRVCTEVAEVDTAGKPLPLVSVASSGFGGANAHVVLEAAPSAHRALLANGNGAGCVRRMSSSRTPSLFCVGALTHRSLLAIADEWKETSEDVPLLAMARTARAMPFRSFATGFDAQRQNLRFAEPRARPDVTPTIVFLFSGQGPQHFHMGRCLFAKYDVFREAVLRGDAAYSEEMGVSLVRDYGLFATPSPGAAADTFAWSIDVTLAAIAVLQMALFDLLVSFGIRPDLLVGHSAGETALLYATGACSRETVVRLAVARGRAFKEIEGSGSMAYFHAPLAQLLPLLEGQQELEIAGFNGPDAYLVSGAAAPLSAFVDEAKAGGYSAGLLRTRTPIHSKLVDRCRETYVSGVHAVFEGLSERKAVHRKPFVSTVTGRFVPSGSFATPDDMWDNARKPVLFSDAIQTVASRAGPGSTVFVELSAHPALAPYVAQTLGTAHVCTVSRRAADWRDADECAKAEGVALLQAIGDLWMEGVDDVHFDLIMRDPCPASPPTFGRSVVAYPYRKARRILQGPGYLSKHVEAWKPLCHPRLRLSQMTHPDLADHIIDGQAIVPASALVEMGFEFGVQEIQNANFYSALSTPKDIAMTVQVVRDGPTYTVRTSTELAKRDGMDEATRMGNVTFDRLVADGTLVGGAPSARPPPVDLETVRSRCPLRVERDEFYGFGQTTSKFGKWFDFGAKFCRVEVAHFREDYSEALGVVRGNVGDLDRYGSYRLHPAILDAAWQAAAALVFPYCSDLGGYMLDYFLPSFARRVRLYGRPSEPSFLSHVTRTLLEPDRMEFNVVATDLRGVVLFTVDGFRLQRLSNAANPHVGAITEIWQPWANVGPFDLERAAISARAPMPVDSMLPTYKALDAWASAMARRIISSGSQPSDLIDRKRHYAWLSSLAQRVSVDKQGSSLAQLAPLKDRHPHHYEIARRLESIWNKVLIDDRAAVEALFRDDVMTHYYKSEASADQSFHNAANLFAQTVRFLAAAGKRAIKVAELGAGTGQLTRLLSRAWSEVLVEQPDLEMEWVITDVSAHLARTAAETIEHGGVSTALFDLNADRPQSGVLPRSFDIVVMADTMHVAKNLDAAISATRSLLVPGGFVLVVEADGGLERARAPGTAFLNFLFGTLKDWWGFADSRSHPLQTCEQWQSHFQRHGFDRFVGMRDEAGTHLRRMVFEARLDPAWTDPVDGANGRYGGDDRTSRVLWHQRGQEAKLVAELTELAQNPDAQLTVCGDSAGALAFGRSLRVDLDIGVRVVLFDSVLTQPAREDLLKRVASVPDHEVEVRFVGDGTMQVCRLVRLLRPEHAAEKMSPLPEWRLVNSRSDTGADAIKLEAAYAPALDPGKVAVTVDGGIFISSGACLVHGQSGQGATLIGFSPLLASKVALNEDLIVRVEAGAVTGQRYLLGLVFALYAIDASGFSVLDPPSSVLFVGGRVMADAFASAASALDIDVVTVIDEPCCGGPEQVLRRLWHLRSRRFDLLVATSALPEAYTARPTSKVAVMFGSQRFPGVEAVELSRDIELLHPRIRRVLRGLKEILAHGPPGDTPDDDGFAIPASELIEAHPSDTPFAVSSTCRAVGVAPDSLQLDAEAWYLIVGGCGGLGVRMARWFVDRGARHICLTSRSGRDTLDRPGWHRERGIIEHIESRAGVELRIAAVDAADAEKSGALVHDLMRTRRLAGLVYLPVQLTDGMITTRTQNDFDVPWGVKVDALGRLLSIVRSETLDFVIGASSLATIAGSAGQATYTIANAGLEELLAPLPNAVAMAVVPLLDGGIYRRTLDDVGTKAALQLGQKWGVKAEDYLQHVEQALLLLRNGKVGVYVPHVDIKTVAESARSRTMGHLVDGRKRSGSKDELEDMPPTDAIVARVLDVDPSKLEPDLALANYGLDSLTGVRLSTELRRELGMEVPQMQVLFSTTLKSLREKYDVEQGRATAVGDEQSEDQGGGATRVFLFPGAGGGTHQLSALASALGGAVVVSKAEEECESLDALAEASRSELVRRQSRGPYLLAGFSFGAIVALRVARLLEAEGRECRLLLVDQSPIYLASPSFLDGARRARDGDLLALGQPVLEAMRAEASEAGKGGGDGHPPPFFDDVSAGALASALTADGVSLPVAKAWASRFRSHMRALSSFVLDAAHEGDRDVVLSLLRVSSPVLLVLASRSFNGGEAEARLLAATLPSCQVEVVDDVSHYSILRSPALFAAARRWFRSDICR